MYYYLVECNEKKLQLFYSTADQSKTSIFDHLSLIQYNKMLYENVHIVLPAQNFESTYPTTEKEMLGFY